MARLVEKMYKKLSDDKTSLPLEIILEDEAKNSHPGNETSQKKMDRKRRRLWNEMQIRERMRFSLTDVMKASWIRMIGATRHINMLHRGIKKLRYDFDIVRVVRMVKN